MVKTPEGVALFTQEGIGVIPLAKGNFHPWEFPEPSSLAKAV
jgi:hypothetical protein